MILDDGPDGSHGGAHPFEKTLDEGVIFSVVNLVKHIVSRYLHSDVCGIPL